MALEFPTRPRLIDKLRLWNAFRPHMGEDGVRDAVEALQDEFAQQPTHDDMRTLMIWMDARLNWLLLRMVLASGTIAGVAVAIAKLT